MTLSFDTTKMLASLFKNHISSQEETLAKIEDAKKLVLLEKVMSSFPYAMKESLQGAIKSEANEIFKLKLLQTACLELSQKIPGFFECFEKNQTYERLTKAFKKAEAWSDEEKEAFIAMNDFTRENCNFLVTLMNGRCAVTEDFEKEASDYLKQWEERHGK